MEEHQKIWDYENELLQRIKALEKENCQLREELDELKAAVKREDEFILGEVNSIKKYDLPKIDKDVSECEDAIRQLRFEEYDLQAEVGVLEKRQMDLKDRIWKLENPTVVVKDPMEEWIGHLGAVMKVLMK